MNHLPRDVRHTRRPLFNKISDYLKYHSSNQPNERALVLGSVSISFVELDIFVRQCAKGLVARGVKSGDRIAVLCTPHPDYFILFLAITSIGGIYVGLNPKYKLQEFIHLVLDSLPTFIFCRTQIDSRNYHRELLAITDIVATTDNLIVLNQDPLLSNSISYHDFIEDGNCISDNSLHVIQSRVKHDDPATIVYTSGTTGKPKGALLPHRGIVRCTLIQLRMWQVKNPSIVNFLPINHVGCIVDTSAYAFIGGGTIHFMERFDAAESLKIVERERISIWGGIPTTLQMCVHLPNFEKYNLSSVELIVWSGAAASLELIECLRNISPQLGSFYGMTETVGSVVYTSVGDSNEVLENTIGRPVECFDVRIVDSKNQVSKIGEEGEIQVKGDFVLLEYWNNSLATKEAFTNDGWFKTGDLGKHREDGNIALVGRLKEMFKSGGYNIYPREIELLLESHSQITKAILVNIPDPLYNEVGYLFYSTRDNQPIPTVDLIEFCLERVANYKVPKIFSNISTFPLLPVGKVDRNQLKQRALVVFGTLKVI